MNSRLCDLPTKQCDVHSRLLACQSVSSLKFETVLKKKDDPDHKVRTHCNPGKYNQRQTIIQNPEKKILND